MDGGENYSPRRLTTPGPLYCTIHGGGPICITDTTWSPSNGVARTRTTVISTTMLDHWTAAGDTSSRDSVSTRSTGTVHTSAKARLSWLYIVGR